MRCERIGWRQQAPAWALMALVAASGCGDDTSTGGNGGSGGSGAGQPQGGAGAGGPQGGAPQGGAPQGGEGEGGGGGPPTCSLDAFNDVAEGLTPLDATPSPDGCVIYFTGYDGAQQAAGVYSVASDGGGVEELTLGGPLASPFGIATSTDGDTLYLADPAADGDGSDGGMIFSMSASGGTPSAVEGADGLTPVALEVREEGNSDQIYFTGRTAAGLPAVYKIAAGGGAADELTTGPASSDFGGIAIASNGDLFFVDTSGALDGSGRIMSLTEGASTATVLLDGLRVGFPSGLAITLDDQTLWLSGLDPVTLTAVIFQIDVDSLDVVSYTGDPDTLEGFREPAGIHRAKDVDIFAFADSRAGAGGTVFAIQP